MGKNKLELKLKGFKMKGFFFFVIFSHAEESEFTVLLKCNFIERLCQTIKISSSCLLVLNYVKCFYV